MLGLLLFTTYINDLPNAFNNPEITTVMYIDNDTFLISINKGEDITNKAKDWN